MVKGYGKFKSWGHDGLRNCYIHFEFKHENNQLLVKKEGYNNPWYKLEKLPDNAILTKKLIKTTLSIDEDLIDYLVENNTHEYNLHKASEEFQELSLILTQKLLKSEQIEEQAIIDEIGDCIIRLEILKKKFPIDKIQARIDKKSAEIINNKIKYKNN